MEIRQYMYLLRRWLWLIVLTALVAGVIAYVTSARQEPIYGASTTLFVVEDANSNYSSLLANERLASSYAERMTNHYVLQATINSLNLDISVEDLKKSLAVSALSQTNLLVLTVEHTDPVVAADLANGVSQAFIERNDAQRFERYVATKERLTSELESVDGEIARVELLQEREQRKESPDEAFIRQTNETLLRLHDTQSSLNQNLENFRLVEIKQESHIVIDEFAQPEERPLRPNVLSNTLLATMAGLLLGIGIIFLFDYVDDTVHGPDDMEEIVGLSTLGTLELLRANKATEALVVAREPRSPAAEAYRQIRTNIQFINPDQESKTILVTSTNPNEGKTTVAANLATALAQSGKKVILVDCDMRRPTLNKLLEIPDKRGLSNLIMRGACDPNYIYSTLVPNLKLIQAGRIPPNPAELLGSERMNILISWLKTRADYVIIDSPPVLPVTDAVILSQIVDTTLFVVSAAQTRYPALIESLERLDAVGSAIAGVVLNKLNPETNGIYYQNYYQIDYRPHVDYQPNWRQRLAKLGFTTFFH
ncbi:MAG: polysaccharide biosynthesis tyrosine autokinase [Chloroflexota bacterium]